MDASPRSRRWTFAVPATLVALLPLVAAAAPSEPDLPNVLVYSATLADRPEGVDHGNEVLAKLAQDTGSFTVEFTEDPVDLNLENLTRFDLVLWNNPSGTNERGQRTAPFDPGQREAYVAWTECGGGFVGIHQALAAWNDWVEWDELVGWVATGASSIGQTALVVLDEAPAATVFGAKGSTFSLTTPLFSHTDGQGPEDLASDVTALLGRKADGDPVAWTSTFRGKNRSFTTGLGATTAMWDLPAFRQHVVRGIADVAKVRPDADCVAGIDLGGEPLLPVGAAAVALSPPGANGTTVPYLLDTIVLPAGSTLQYANLDTVTHTITEAAARPRFDSGFVNLGGAAAVTGVESLSPGVYDFYCTLHPLMVGTLTIV